MRENSASRFQESQSNRQQRREVLIRNFLDLARRSMTHYKNVTSIAAAAAKHIRFVEGSDCNYATLMGNQRYKTLLLSYMEEQFEQAKHCTKELGTETFPVHALFVRARLEIANLKRENEALKAQIIEMQGSPHTSALQSHHSLASDTVMQGEARSEVEELKSKYVQTCETVSRLIEHFDDHMFLDLDKKQMIAKASASLGNNVIVDTSMAGPFFEWLRKI